MALVLATCETCGIFFSAANFSGGNVRNITIQNVGVGPCPRCGGMGKVPDGIYDFVDNTIRLLSGPQRTVPELTRIQALLIALQARNANAEEIKEEIAKEAPELQTLTDYFPKKRTELYAFLALIIAVITLLINTCGKSTSASITVEQVINNIKVEQAVTQSTSQPIEVQKLNPAGKPKRIKKIRNLPCNCGSGKSFKKCHGESL